MPKSLQGALTNHGLPRRTPGQSKWPFPYGIRLVPPTVPRSVHGKAAVTMDPLEAVTCPSPGGPGHTLAFQSVYIPLNTDLRPNTSSLLRLLSPTLEGHMLGGTDVPREAHLYRSRNESTQGQEPRHLHRCGGVEKHTWPSLSLCSMAHQVHSLSKFPMEGLLGAGPTAKPRRAQQESPQQAVTGPQEWLV